MKFKGIIPPVSTIFDKQGKLDEKGMSKLIDSLIDAGVNGLFFLGTGGEFSQMSNTERKETAEFCVNYVNSRVPTLIGTGSTSTREVIELNTHSKEIGADGVVIINPYYWPLSEFNLFKHYSTIAKKTELPIVLYNFPDLTGQELKPDFVLKLAQKHENIVGIKDTVDQAGHIRELLLKIKPVRPEFSVFCGFDDHLLNTLSLGGAGAISASTNFLPELTVKLYDSFVKENYEMAINLHQKLASLPILYKLDTPFVNVVKEAIKVMGLDIPTYVLPPSSSLNSEKKKELIKILKENDFI